MKTLLIAALVATPVFALADNRPLQKAPAPVAKVQTTPFISKATRLSDAELDKVTAGTAEVTTGGGLTIILNPGNANVFKQNPRGHLLCINC